MQNTFEYLVIGAGPAGIAAIAKLYGQGIRSIAWLDPEFKVGAFGTVLSTGSAVPGNTTVNSYRQVIQGIYAAIPSIPVKRHALDEIAHDKACYLNIAREPFQYLSDELLSLVTSITGFATELLHTANGITVIYQTADKTLQHFYAKRVILAIGAAPKTLALPEHITLIDPHVAFIASRVKTYLEQNPQLKKVAIIGSSHSAALACMQFLKAHIPVKQFMNKPYRFATPITQPNGEVYVQFDNTGLKAEVARYTRALLANPDPLWECTQTPFAASELTDVTHAVFCIGYAVNSSLLLNGKPLTAFHYDTLHSQFLTAENVAVPGIFGVGIAYPKQVTSPAGEIEFAVGVRKFWASFDAAMLKRWQDAAHF